MSPGKKIAVAAGVVVLIAAVVVVNLKFERKKKITVQTEKIETRRLKSVVTASGKIKPKKQVNISASTIGKVTKLAVAEGDLVTQGQFLLQIDPAPLAAQVSALEASIAAAKAGLAQARASLEQAKLELGRLSELKKSDLATGQDIDRASTSVQVEAARSQAGEREIERLEANLRSAHHMLSQVTFDAPLAGLITAAPVPQYRIEKNRQAVAWAARDFAAALQRQREKARQPGAMSVRAIQTYGCPLLCSDAP